MKRNMNKLMVAFMMAGAASAFGQAHSSAGIGAGYRNYATATGGYRGPGIGWGNTEAQTGKINFAHGLGVGVDQRGLSLSSSYALGSKFGPAVAGTFNLGISPDGRVNGSVGRVAAEGGGPTQEVNAGGFASPGRYGSAGATAGGRNGPGGVVRSNVDSWQGGRIHPTGLGAARHDSAPVGYRTVGTTRMPIVVSRR